MVPSQTELLYALGLDEEVKGITKFCVHPPHWLKEKQRIGGTKNPNLPAIKALKPDLIVANFEENRKEDIEVLAREFPVWVTDVTNLDTAIQMIADLGKLLHKEKQALELGNKILSLKASKGHFLKNKKVLNAAYLIWKKPYMTIGGDTFINSMLLEAGMKNVFEGEKRYPEISLEDRGLKQAELILLSTEPYPFSHKDLEEMKEIFPQKEVLIVDGEMFSWFGSRILKAIPYLSGLRTRV